jgi:hypothetical protein
MSIERTSQIRLAAVELSLRGPTMADVLAGLATNPNISAGRLVALRSAVRTYYRAQGKDPAAVSAEPRAVREVLSRLTPDALGISPQSFLNLRSLMGKALDAAGIETIPVRCRTRLEPAWARLMDRVDDRRMRYALLRPLTLLSAAGVQPQDISQAAVDALARAIEERQVLRRPRQANRAFIQQWNRARMSIPDWPQVELRIDDRRNRYVLRPRPFSLRCGLISPSGFGQFRPFRSAAAGHRCVRAPSTATVSCCGSWRQQPFTPVSPSPRFPRSGR